MNRLDDLSETAFSLGCEVRKSELMSRHTTFRIGGPADLFLTVPNAEALSAVCRKARENDVPLFVLGNGSNLLVSDDGFRGAVLTLGDDFRTISPEGNSAVRCGAGVSLSTLCTWAKNSGLSGLEFAWGIPGSVGGAAFMNAGAYGHSVSEIITSCSHLAPDGTHGSFSAEQLAFGYRRSAYSAGGSVVTLVCFQLSPGDKAVVSSQMDDYLERRKAKQPLELPSAGSVFKRPEGHFAGALIEQCGLRGKRIGGASVSEKHAGFIVNLGGASCADVTRLIELIQETVLRQTGVALECEIRFLG